MARLIALAPFDLQQIDFNWYYRNFYESALEKGINLNIEGTTYQDVLAVNGYDGFTDLILSFFGSNINQRADGTVTSGTIGLIAESDFNTEEVYWFIDGISLSAVSLYNAYLTLTNSDDLALAESALNSHDTIYMSDFSDRISAYNGNDSVYGFGGDDTLDGGNGTDTAFFADEVENVSVSFHGSTVIVTTQTEGIDRLTNFEFAQFGDQLRTISSLSDTKAPDVLTFSPANQSTSVAADTNLVFTFDEAIARGLGIISLRSGSPSGPIIEQFDAGASDRISISGTTLTLNPSSDLNLGNQYFLDLGFGSVTDLAGNRFQGLGTYSFTTLAPNSPPLVNPTQNLQISEDMGLSGVIGASDPDGDPLTFSISTPAQNGHASTDTNGSFTYTPNPDFNGGDSFKVTVSDGNGGTVVQTINVSVTAVNDNPVVASSQTVNAAIMTSAQITVSANDIDGDPLSFSAGPAGSGMVTGGANGNFTYTPSSGFFGTDTFNVTVSDGQGGSVSQTVTIMVGPPPASDFRLFSADSFVGQIGGSGAVFGTGTGLQDITILDQPGSISLDPSFNRGGDIVRLAGDASNWSVARLGSNAVFSDGDTFVQIPVGVFGMPVVFDDGIRTLKFDGTTFKIGAQFFGGTQVQIDTPPDGTQFPNGADPAAKGILFLAEGAGVSAAGFIDIFGTASAEPVKLIAGNMTLDASFNRGGDSIGFDEAATDFIASRSGSSLVLTGSDAQALIPVGTAGATLIFGDGTDTRTVLFDTTIPAITIGGQLITADPVQLMAA